MTDILIVVVPKSENILFGTLDLMNTGPPNSGFNRHVKNAWLPLILFSILDPAESQALANWFVQS